MRYSQQSVAGPRGHPKERHFGLVTVLLRGGAVLPNSVECRTEIELTTRRAPCRLAPKLPVLRAVRVFAPCAGKRWSSSARATAIVHLRLALTCRSLLPQIRRMKTDPRCSESLLPVFLPSRSTRRWTLPIREGPKSALGRTRRQARQPCPESLACYAHAGAPLRRDASSARWQPWPSCTDAVQRRPA